MSRFSDALCIKALRRGSAKVSAQSAIPQQVFLLKLIYPDVLTAKACLRCRCKEKKRNKKQHILIMKSCCNGTPYIFSGKPSHYRAFRMEMQT